MEIFQPIHGNCRCRALLGMWDKVVQAVPEGEIDLSTNTERKKPNRYTTNYGWFERPAPLKYYTISEEVRNQKQIKRICGDYNLLRLYIAVSIRLRSDNNNYMY